MLMSHHYTNFTAILNTVPFRIGTFLKIENVFFCINLSYKSSIKLKDLTYTQVVAFVSSAEFVYF